TAFLKVELSREDRVALAARQEWQCADCFDDLKVFEVDHRVPLSFGGSNDLDNLAVVCRSCHAQKSYHENVSSAEDRNPLISRFNRETYREFVLSPKPPQMVANVRPPSENRPTVQADVIRCRYTQFLENLHDLPVFCALDDPKPTRRGCLGDYHWVHRTRDLRSMQKLLPYWGPGWYWRADVAWMLDVGTITWDDMKWTLTASAHFP
ncbi:MAG: HNH endonuclease, partial [Propionibacteriaceae bacterium]|nr:HNH endonuclease [Propionibacteriaceae bacterium]